MDLFIFKALNTLMDCTWWGIVSLFIIYLLLSIIIWTHNLIVWGELSFIIADVQVRKCKINNLKAIQKEETWNNFMVKLGKLLGWIMMILIFMIGILIGRGELLTTSIVVSIMAALFIAGFYMNKHFETQDLLPFLADKIEKLNLYKSALLEKAKKSKK